MKLTRDTIIEGQIVKKGIDVEIISEQVLKESRISKKRFVDVFLNRPISIVTVKNPPNNYYTARLERPKMGVEGSKVSFNKTKYNGIILDLDSVVSIDTGRNQDEVIVDTKGGSLYRIDFGY